MKGSEQGIVRSILEYLSLRKYVCWRNNTGGFVKGDHFYRFGLVGSGDIMGLTRDGRFFSIEVKKEGKKPTEYQKQFIEDVTKSKGISFVAYSVDDVIHAGL